MDSKKELDKLLKATCEAFIMAITKLTVEPMLSFITKVTAFRVAPALSAGQPLRQQVLAPPPPPPLLPPAGSLRCICNRKKHP